jgi:hypothetical protein
MTTTASDKSPHLTVPQLAARWQTTPAAIYIARHRGKAPKGFKRGVNVLFPLAAVEAFEAQQMADDRPSHRGTAAEYRPAEPSRPRRSRRAAPAGA